MPDDKLARALGAKIRRDMLRLLIDKELTVHKIADKLKLTEVNASKHLKKLYDLGLLETRINGRERFYTSKITEMRNLMSWYDKVVTKISR